MIDVRVCKTGLGNNNNNNNNNFIKLGILISYYSTTTVTSFSWQSSADLLYAKFIFNSNNFIANASRLTLEVLSPN